MISPIPHNLRSIDFYISFLFALLCPPSHINFKKNICLHIISFNHLEYLSIFVCLQCCRHCFFHLIVNFISIFFHSNATNNLYWPGVILLIYAPDFSRVFVCDGDIDQESWLKIKFLCPLVVVSFSSHLYMK